MEVPVTVKLVQDDVGQSASGKCELSFILQVVLVTGCRVGRRPKPFVFTFSSGVPRCAAYPELQRVPGRRLWVPRQGAAGAASPPVPEENRGLVELSPATSGRAEQTLPVPVDLHVSDRTFLRQPRGDQLISENILKSMTESQNFKSRKYSEPQVFRTVKAWTKF